MAGTVHHIQTSGLHLVPWQLEAARLLEENHVCASGPDARQRERFTIDLGTSLAKFDDTVVCTLDGEKTLDLQSLCEELERVLGTGRVARTLDGSSGVVDALRRRPQIAGAPAVKRRFIVWHEAHVLLAHDSALFGGPRTRSWASRPSTSSPPTMCCSSSGQCCRFARDRRVCRGPSRPVQPLVRREGRDAAVAGGHRRRAPRVARWRIGAEVDAP